MVAYGCVLITGASSGLGRALALALAAPGVVLHLSGRDGDRLRATARDCAARGAAVREQVLDVRDAAAMASWVAAAGRLDLVVANAGISAGTGDGRAETPAQTRAIFAANLDGVLNTVLPALAVMRTQAPDGQGVRGRIAVVASIAGFIASPGAPAYCASKAAVDAWTVATAAGVRREGVVMTSICPGFVRTAMTARNRFPMPGLMDAEPAAGIILRGIAAGRRRVVFPWWMGLAARLAGLLPPRLSGALLGRAPGKAGLSGSA
ncbi:Oxidoreductase, short-chain dehydrogenase/reductase family [Rhodovastum atsumiense]|uniref:SDR family NAD(P)-dependent oxidoreductase n=1 Tax=Rhodovastum atsumiense TaxID=504468 RepID=A0A5M6IVE9_9PROT|nr:SDR family NAD(P)-dependent oxidoreductase [Rhodovastum atsumiense]KAA5612252.1 SDR family NAD(P)-dependent oxidoreductase [Rhodovastum atsumiense]CAH2601575.1 Oxidoreductase, short-chain dehydrogenase/reductase family [Rhodovastum atsumiense]